MTVLIAQKKKKRLGGRGEQTTTARAKLGDLQHCTQGMRTIEVKSAAQVFSNFCNRVKRDAK